MLQERGERLARRGVPHPRGLVPSGDDAAPVRAERAPPNPALMLQGRRQRPARVARPTPARSCRSEAVTMRLPSGLNARANHRTLMLQGRAEPALPRAGVPHPRGLVLGRGDDAAPVRAELRAQTLP